MIHDKRCYCARDSLTILERSWVIHVVQLSAFIAGISLLARGVPGGDRLREVARESPRLPGRSSLGKMKYAEGFGGHRWGGVPWIAFDGSTFGGGTSGHCDR